MNEQFIDKVINILIESRLTELRKENFGGVQGGGLKHPESRKRALGILALKRGDISWVKKAKQRAAAAKLPK